MRRTLARLLVALGAGLVALGRRLDKPTPPASRAVIKLARGNYRIKNRAPGRGETIRLGLAILFSSARYGLIGV